MNEHDERNVRNGNLWDILRNHSLWVETDGKEGQQLDLTGADLRKANLTSVVLDEATMVGSRFWKADLSHTDMRGADLTECETGKLPTYWRDQNRKTISEDRKQALRSQGI